MFFVKVTKYFVRYVFRSSYKVFCLLQNISFVTFFGKVTIAAMAVTASAEVPKFGGQSQVTALVTLKLT